MSAARRAHAAIVQRGRDAGERRNPFAPEILKHWLKLQRVRIGTLLNGC
jgi:hypothetical protein